MKMKLFRKFHKEEGSATIEAVVSFTGFLFVIFTLLSLVNLCRAQMLISSAMDNAAKELSQYSYFYKMSGLQKIDKALNDKAEVGKSHINEVIGSVDNLYGSMVNAVDSTTEDYTNIAEATKNGSLDMSAFQNAYNNLSSEKENVVSNINKMTEQFQNVGDNPMLYMKSLVAIASSSGLDLIKSHAIAAPIAKFFVRQQFGKTPEEANQTLEVLGVKKGLDGLNFTMSTVFSQTHPEDIRLVVYYKLTLLQLFDWEILEVNMCKQSACRAWLAGDNPEEFELKEDLPTTPPAGDEGSDEGSDEGTNEDTGEGNEGSNEGSEEGNDAPTDGENPTEPPEEETPPEQEKVDTTGSYWHLDAAGKYQAVLNLTYNNSIGCDFLHHLAKVNGVPVQPTQSTADTLVKDNPTHLFRSHTIVQSNDGTDSVIYLQVLESFKAIETYLEAHDGDKVVERTLYFEVYVPENISDEEYEKLEKEIEEAEEKLDEMIDIMTREDYTGDITTAQNADYEIRIIKAGGNYDYSSGGGQ